MSDKPKKETREKVCAVELFCDNCAFYPIIPVHGHFECPRCHMPTKCCEGMALEE